MHSANGYNIMSSVSLAPREVFINFSCSQQEKKRIWIEWCRRKVILSPSETFFVCLCPLVHYLHFAARPNSLSCWYCCLTIQSLTYFMYLFMKECQWLAPNTVLLNSFRNPRSKGELKKIKQNKEQAKVEREKKMSPSIRMRFLPDWIAISPPLINPRPWSAE